VDRVEGFVKASALDALRERIAHAGFAFAPAAEMAPLLGSLPDWHAFAASWDDLELDTHLPDGHRYRRRRHGTFSLAAGAAHVTREPHRPHYQGLEYNPLVGGIERWFEPMRGDVVGGATFARVMDFCVRLFAPMKPASTWHIECHQFRIEARRDAPGQPTPEGVHRDGVDYVLVLLIARANIASGTTTTHDLAGNQLGSFTLSAPLDAALVDDARVKHGVTPVEPIDPARPAHRDVLVVTFRAK
jgi:hypothetical protein